MLHHRPRAAKIQLFLDLARDAIHAGNPSAAADDAAGRIFVALGQKSTASGHAAPDRLPVCRYLEPALADAGAESGPVSGLAAALASVEPELSWTLRARAAAEGPQFLNGHANAMIIGPGGLEVRSDVWVGVSLMAPNTRYPDHSHPPEEVYVALSPGEWRQQGGPWHSPGIGGLVYNPPNIVHSMRSADRPLLALWFLWIGEEAPVITTSS